MSTGTKNSAPHSTPRANGPYENEEPKYKLEDFSQKAINEGQQKINGELTELGKTLAYTLKALKEAIEGLPVGSQIKFGAAIGDDITKAINISEGVAGYYPPGCNYSPPGGGQGSGGTGGPDT